MRLFVSLLCDLSIVFSDISRTFLRTFVFLHHRLVLGMGQLFSSVTWLTAGKNVRVRYTMLLLLLTTNLGNWPHV